MIRSIKKEKNASVTKTKAENMFLCVAVKNCILHKINHHEN
jgi:hypothetical protein